MELDHEDNGSDIEAQRSSPLLMNGELGKSSLIMRKSALIFKSTYKFIEAGARIASLSRVSSSSTTTFYTPLPSFNLKHGVCIYKTYIYAYSLKLYIDDINYICSLSN